MKKEKQYRVNKWKEVRKKGKKNFIIYKGIIGWGLTTGILFSIFQLFLLDGLCLYQLLTGNSLAKFAVNILLFMLAGGIFFGPILWAINEKQYHH